MTEQSNEKLKKIEVPTQNLEQLPKATSEKEIDAVRVNLLGREILEASTEKFQNVEVIPFDPDKFIPSQINEIQANEGKVNEELEGKPILDENQLMEMRNKASSVMKATKEKATALPAYNELRRMFTEMRRAIMLVKPEVYRPLGVDANFCAVIKRASQPQIKTAMEGVNYTIISDGDKGFYANSADGSNRLYFMYAAQTLQEKQPAKPETKKKKVNKKPEDQEKANEDEEKNKTEIKQQAA
ncbi:MAG: hypothetical protein NTZ49_00810 [Candidatus Parcubacteria bacterium]|nr:hypothetical protein [Candidatus Parcubacteria bacterium]